VKAAVMYEVNKPLVIEDVRIDKPRAREVLIRTRAVGVCHSDLHFLDGSFPYPLPVILGHEASGVVEEVGADVRGVKAGDHVITCLTAFCGHCEHCLNGRMNLCISPETRREPTDPQQRLAKNGGPVNQFANLSAFAEMMLVHEHACVAIRKDMPFDRAALIGCAVLTGVGAVTRRANVMVGETVAVIGCGAVGLAAINGAAIAGAGRVIAIDRVGSKLNLARHFGATDVIDASKEDPVAKVIEMTGGGVPHSFEAVGLKQTAEQAFKMLRRGGTANVIGMIAVGVNIEIPGRDFLGEKSIRGCFMGSNRFPLDMPRLVDLYMAGKLKLDDMISQRIGLKEINSAFDELKRGELARSVILFN
jgi:S-(hydroxymethyl)glutathione dehydrogenase/alcohol dehydrogenase